jgi:hypothetical protein
MKDPKQFTAILLLILALTLTTNQQCSIGTNSDQLQTGNAITI